MSWYDYVTGYSKYPTEAQETGRGRRGHFVDNWYVRDDNWTGLTTGLTTGSLFMEGRPVLFPFCFRGASLGTHDTPEPGTQPSAQAQLIPYQAPLRR